VGWGGVWGVWAGPGLVWIQCGVVDVARLWGGSFLAVCHRSSIIVCSCWLDVALCWGAVAGGRRRGRPPDGARCSRRAGLEQCRSFVEMCIVSYLSAAAACVCVSCSTCRRVRLAVVTLQPCSTEPAVAGCRLVVCSGVSGRTLQSHDVTGVSQRVSVCLGPVLVSRALSPPEVVWRGLGWVPIAGWNLGGVGPDRESSGGRKKGVV